MPREVSKLVNNVVNNLSAIFIMSNGFTFEAQKKFDWFSLFSMKVNEESFVSETRLQ